MLPKSGNLADSSNWRPIAILPIFYKLFARMIYNRISPTLLAHQSEDQHAFTPGVRIEDALLCAEIAVEHSLEFNVPLWVMNMDLRKAYDSIDRERFLNLLRRYGMGPRICAYVETVWENLVFVLRQAQFYSDKVNVNRVCT